MSEIKPVLSIKTVEERIAVVGAYNHHDMVFNTATVSIAKYHAMKEEASELRAAYEALQKENGELKRNHKFTCENLLDTAPFIEELEQKNAEQARRIEEAVSRIKDMLENDDGQAHKEARKFIESLSASKNGES